MKPLKYKIMKLLYLNSLICDGNAEEDKWLEVINELTWLPNRTTGARSTADDT